MAVGTVAVNGPVLACLLGIPFGAWFLFGSVPVVAISAVLGFVLGWTWWSFSVPKWRFWALRRVGDSDRLQDLSVAVGLSWPEGHYFEKTEFRPAGYEAQLADAEAADDLDDAFLNRGG